MPLNLGELHGFGRIEARDPRDLRMALALTTDPVPSSAFWQAGAPLNQGTTPRCVGFAWAGFLSATPMRTNDGPSPGDIYLAAQKLDEWPGEAYDGTSIRGGVKVLAERGRIAEYRFAQNANDVRTWLAQRGPVIFGSEWTQGMLYPDGQGVVAGTGPVVGGHAYLCVGYEDRRAAFRCVNSWGTGWGQWGRFWLPYQLADSLMQRGGEACSAIEKAP